MLFMTAGYRQTNDGMYILDNERKWHRTLNRFEDFKRRNLVGGELAAPEVTFSGLMELERRVTVNETTQDTMQQLIDVLRENNAQTAKIEELLRFQEYNNDNKLRISDVISNMANIASIVSSVPFPTQENSIIKMVFSGLFQCLGR